MRQIKFRAWNLLTEGMVTDETVMIDTDGSIEVGGYSTIDENGGAIVVMQYTGLKDKNGVEIFEGDIVKPIDDSRHFGNLQIIFRSGQFLPDGSQWSLAGFVSNYECEVIGNIYENPELLDSPTQSSKGSV